QFFIHEGLKLTGFLSALFANPPALGFMSDLLFTSFVFLIMMFHEQKHGGAGLGWPSPRFREIVDRVPFENRDAFEMIAQNPRGQQSGKTATNDHGMGPVRGERGSHVELRDRKKS
ncbi:MAG: DUF2834 domain-containing protein, partial [Nitrospira sp.]|nr:DUF2834 domain-containing protein [Nitrospira sp.]